MVAVTHDERMKRLRAEVDIECGRRWARRLGGKLTSEGRVPDEDRFVYDVEGERERYAASRRIEDEARRKWRALERAAKDLGKFAAKYEAGAGAHVAEAIVVSLPKLKEVLHLPYDVPSSGAAAFAGRPPSRVTFVVEKLEALAFTLGKSDPRELDVQLLAIMTLLAGFWPYTATAELLFEKEGYPTAAKVIAKEAERLRSLLRRPAP
jgi:hypothetical protein